jgi:hypothetical protein
MDTIVSSERIHETAQIERSEGALLARPHEIRGSRHRSEKGRGRATMLAVLPRPIVALAQIVTALYVAARNSIHIE